MLPVSPSQESTQPQEGDTRADGEQRQAQVALEAAAARQAESHRAHHIHSAGHAGASRERGQTPAFLSTTAHSTTHRWGNSQVHAASAARTTALTILCETAERGPTKIQLKGSYENSTQIGNIWSWLGSEDRGSCIPLERT